MGSEPVLTEVLAEGRTFEVHRGVQTPGDRPVVCKRTAPGAPAGPAAARLENEFTITRAVSHPGLVRADAMLATARGPMLVFPDEGLRALSLAGKAAMQPQQVRAVAVQIGAALAALHRAGIVHRDVKPSNIVASTECSVVKLIDHCLAVRADDLAAEAPGSFSALGTAAYMAPEQSGRMNRHVDHRADLYSLGITLYHLATGHPPFQAEDAAELVFRHMTEVPPNPRSRNAAVPEDLDRAIMTLIAKNPEDRFQRAEDLLAALQQGGRPTVDRLTVPDRLYGRDPLIQAVSTDLVRTAPGPTRLIRVTGPSGVGKSATIAAMVAPALANGAVFLQGKFDQIERARPYGPFLHAAQSLRRRLLSGPADQLKDWRDRLNSALRPNGQVLLDLMPDFEAVIGPQPAVAELGLNEARIRMSLVFRRFFRALAQPDAPLILFFDDLQWSDAASRQLIETIALDREIASVTLITAYRDNEVGPGHPVRALFRSLDETTGLEEPIILKPLGEPDVADLLSDTLGWPREGVTGLAHLTTSKTGGNPFFLRQFLGSLVRKGLLHHDGQGWRWDIDTIRAQKLTENVADLVGERLSDLPDETRALIDLASCCGNTFDAQTLALVQEQPCDAIVAALDPAIAADIIHLAPADDTAPVDDAPASSVYRFQHDRIQTTVHDGLAEEDRGRLHGRIGTLLLAKLTDAGAESRLVEITDHLIAGRDHLDQRHLEALLEMAKAAARQARQTNAWDAALSYLHVVQDLLGPESWRRAGSAIFEVVLQRAEVSYLLADIDGALALSEDLLDQDLSVLERVRVLELQILVHTAQLRYRQALTVGQQALTLLGEHMPLSPGPAGLLRRFARTKIRLQGRSDADLLALPHMTDPERLATIRVLGLMAAPAYFTETYLLPLIGLRIVDLTIKHGNAPHSPYGWVILGMLHCAVLGSPVRGRAYADLALRSAKALGSRDIECRIMMVSAGFIQHWTAPLTDTLPVFEEGWESAIAVGDLEYHGYTRYGHASYALMAGHALPKVSDLLDEHLAAVTQHTHEKTQRIMWMARASVARMRGLEPPADCPFDPKENHRVWREQRDATSLAYVHKYQLLEALMVGDYPGVLDQAQAMTQNLNGILSMAYQPFYRFYQALALLASARDAKGLRRIRLRVQARRVEREYSGWVKPAPKTHHHRALLLKAERQALSGRFGGAMRGFEAAIDAARRAGALHDLGLFYERAALAYLANNAVGAATAYLREAYAAYDNWGGTAWANALQARHPTVSLAPVTRLDLGTSMASESSSSGGQIVDSATLIAAATALATKTTLSGVVQEVMRAIVVNAGADRGVLLLADKGALVPVAEAHGAKVTLLDPDAPFQAVPERVLNYVRHAKAPLVLDDALVDPNFNADPYLSEVQPSSILAVPLMAKGDLTGLVYLENAHVRAAFTPDRCRTVEVLGAQAAVSVENTRLLDDLRSALERQVDLTSAHARFVPHSFLQVLNRPSIEQIELGDHVQAEASILFSDIRGFTAMVETMEPREAIEFINAYLSRMEPAVQAQGGFVDSYIGDAVMAVFDKGPEAAITAGLTMLRALRAWSRARAGAQATQTGAVPIRIGIGIATGEIMFGTIGAANRMKCGVIGSTVNLASRIEGLTKRYGLGMLITQGTYRALHQPEQFQIREVDLVRVVGRSAPVRLFEVYDADPQALRAQKARTADDLSRAQRLYMNGAVDQAYGILEQCALVAPDDPLIPVMLERCRRAADRASDPDWDGIHVAVEK